MMQKKKKKAEIDKTAGPAVAVQMPQTDMLMDNMVRVIGNFGFQQIVLPPVEERQIFAKSESLSRLFGDNLLRVPDFPGQDMILAPTRMPAMIRRYLNNVKNFGPHVNKWFNVSPVLRFVDGKYESSHEVGLYVLGEDSALGSAQLINTASEIFRALGSGEFVVQINSLGCVGCKSSYRDLLSSVLPGKENKLCRDCEADFENNPLVMWSCATDSCRELIAGLPPIIDSLDESCKANLMGVLESIDELNIPYTLNPLLTPQYLRHQVVFQIVPTTEGTTTSVGYGGNFSSFALELGSPEQTPILAMLTSFEKLLDIIPEERRRETQKVEVFMVPLGSIAARKAMVLHRDLQHSGIIAAEAMLISPSIKNQLKVAAEKKCEIALIIGQKEAIDETVILRDMRSGMQEVFAADRIIEEVKKRLGK